MGDVQLGARFHVHRQELGHRNGFADGRAGGQVGIGIGEIHRQRRLFVEGDQLGALGVYHDRQAGAGDGLERAHLVRLVGEGEAEELIVTSGGRLGGEDLEGDGTRLGHGLDACVGQVARSAENAEVDAGMLGEVPAPHVHPLGRVAAGLADRHFEQRGDAASRCGPGLAFHRAPLRIGRSADVEVDVDDAGQEGLTCPVDRPCRLTRATGQQPSDLAAGNGDIDSAQPLLEQDVRVSDDGVVTRQDLSPSSVRALATPSRLVRCMLA